jgi:signal transduction histidine kinase
VLYERSDERLREVAKENERLYRRANEGRQTLAAIMGSMSDGLLLTGVDCVVLNANPGASAITGLAVTGADPAAGLVGSHIATVHAAVRSAAEHPKQHDHERARAEAGKVQSWQLEMTRDHRALAIQLRLFDVHDNAGRVIGRGLLLRDVRREHEMDQCKSTLLAAVGHELRTPLAAIKGNASTLLQHDVAWPEDDQRHFLSTISSAADRLAQLVTNLLDLSRLEAGLLALHRSPSALANLVADASHRLSAPPADLRVAIPPNLPPLDVDAARIEVVLQNLLANAVTYGDGKVSVTAAREGDMARASVANDGPGISAEDLPHIFERFYRAPRGRKLRSSGTGLGLAISKAFVEARGGTIWTESDGQGATFSLTLPLAIPAGKRTPDRRSVPSRPRSRTRAKRVKEGSRA